MRALTLVLAALAACSKIIGIDDISGPPPNTVIGRSYTRYLTPAGTMDVPRDLSQATIQALIIDDAEPSGYRVSIGAGKPDGTFSIPDVPDGAPYLLKLIASSLEEKAVFYFATTLHVIDHHFEYPVRGVPAPTPSSSKTMVDFDVQGMTPFVEGPDFVHSHIEIRSLNLNYEGNINLPHNARALTKPYAWAQGEARLSNIVPLPEAALGDDLTILHSRREPIQGTSRRTQTLTRVIDMFMPSGVTITNGATTKINGSWAPGVWDKSMELVVERGAFEASYDGTSRGLGASVELLAQPVSNASNYLGYYVFSFGATVFNATIGDWSHSANLTEFLNFAYSDPFPGDWSRVVAITYERSREVRLPNTTNGSSIDASSVYEFLYTGGQVEATPALQPPASLEVAGKSASAGGLVSFDGSAPVEVTWNAVAAARSYTVFVGRVFSEGTSTEVGLAAILNTSQTSIKIPAEVFTGSEFFTFSVAAVWSPANYDAGQMIASGIPYFFAPTPSGLFRLSRLCGNGTKDLGEECDTGVAGPICDIDCTLPQCGDGLWNASAGEACDAAQDTVGCDADCTLPTCGDGHLNRAVEDCDDGNTTDQGNGCSTTCRFNNVCGNGIIESLVESCDSGGGGIDTTMCDSDCTPVQCGDRHRNAAAGEQCDDGNGDNNDGCNSMCKTM